MVIQALHLPDAIDLDVMKVRPTREFEACNPLLDRHADLKAFYQENGYLFFRDVLDLNLVARARDEMLAIAADHFGLVKKGDPTARWTGKPLQGWSEESPLFAGISRRLVEHPSTLAVMEKILGEPACMVPNVQYRLYPPGGPVTIIHQDGFYSPGIQDYKPVWVPLVSCPREVGGLMVAVGQHKRGYFHNVAKPNPYPIPVGHVDEGSWATADYEPGDVLIVHPYAPHGGTPNSSDRLRVTFDTRVQSAHNPSAFAATVTAVTPRAVTVQADDPVLGTLTLAVDEDTFIRVRNPGIRENFADLTNSAVPGTHLVVVRDGQRAVMLRCGTHP